MTTYTFCFGNAPGKYSPCNCLTDSLFTMETIDFFILDNQIDQNPIQNFNLGTLDLSVYTISASSQLKVFYE